MLPTMLCEFKKFGKTHIKCRRCERLLRPGSAKRVKAVCSGFSRLMRFVNITIGDGPEIRVKVWYVKEEDFWFGTIEGAVIESVILNPEKGTLTLFGADVVVLAKMTDSEFIEAENLQRFTCEPAASQFGERIVARIINPPPKS
jgi:hypothetical protein